VPDLIKNYIDKTFSAFIDWYSWDQLEFFWRYPKVFFSF